MDTIGKVRRLHFVEKRSIKAIARELRLARDPETRFGPTCSARQGSLQIKYS